MACMLLKGLFCKLVELVRNCRVEVKCVGLLVPNEHKLKLESKRFSVS